MAVVLGTSSGFVTVAPTTNPDGGSTSQIDTRAWVTKDVSPATAARITEVGWYCEAATEEANFEIGLYAADGAVVPGEAGTLLEVSRTNAKGTTAGWKVVTGLNWTISSSTSYWLGLQLDDTATNTFWRGEATGGLGTDGLTSQTTLPDPFGGGALVDVDAMIAIYAVWEAAPSTSTGNFFAIL